MPGYMKENYVHLTLEGKKRTESVMNYDFHFRLVKLKYGDKFLFPTTDEREKKRIHNTLSVRLNRLLKDGRIDTRFIVRTTDAGCTVERFYRDGYFQEG